jgi:rRNA-processing protein FCF1
VRQAGLVRLRDGTDVRQLIGNLRRWESELTRAADSDLGSSKDLWGSYVRDYIDEVKREPWALECWYWEEIDEIESFLRNAADDPDVTGGLFNDRYWRVISDESETPAPTRYGFSQVCLYQAGCLKRIREQLESVASCARGAGTVVVPDTNVFAHCGTVSDINWRALAGGTTVRIIVPHVVVDELDDLKRTGRDKDVRLRVRTAISALKQVLGDTSAGSAARVGDGVTVAILPDPPGHQRLPSNDEEICDRALVVRQFTAPVLLATNDMGMHVRAHAFGLEVLEVPER